MENLGGERIRLATFDDLEAIKDINDNIYEGFDYMPALFYTYMHSKQHVIYVHEKDGKLNGIMMFWLHPYVNDIITTMAGRVRPSFQGQGITRFETSPILHQFTKDHPEWRGAISATPLKPTLRRKLNTWTILYIWNLLRYDLADRQQLLRFATQGENIARGMKPVTLSYSDATAWLACSDQLVQFVSKFTAEFIPLQPTGMPLQVNKCGLRQVFATTNTLLTYANFPPDEVEPPAATSSTRKIGLMHDEKDQTGKTEQQVVGFSLSTGVPCKYGFRVDIFFFGNDEDVLLSHVCSHVRHYVTMTQDDVKIGLLLHFPKGIDSCNIEERLKGDLGKRACTDTFSVTECFLYLRQRPQLLSAL